jgi:enterochelin esterase-like enzyme
MPCMVNRQANIILPGLIASLLFLAGCAPNTPLPAPTQTPAPQTLTPTSVPTPSETPVPSPTPDPCLGTRGTVEEIAFDSTALPSFYIYLPECYARDVGTRYPVLYLLHGQNYQADQWLRLGAPQIVGGMIAAGNAPPFIIVMPFNVASWRGADVDEFGEVFINDFIPFIDQNYRTVATRGKRALGGLSRGGGWAIRYGLTRPDLFGAFGAHSPAIFYRDYSKLDDWLREIPEDEVPLIYIDIGDADGDLADARNFADLLAEMGVVHEWHLYTGSHEEGYWQAHAEEYLFWYGEFFQGGQTE